MHTLTFFAHLAVLVITMGSLYGVVMVVGMAVRP